MNNIITFHPHRNARTNAIVTGIFFIMASASAITGLLLYNPVLLGNPDFLQTASMGHQIALGAFFELLLVCSNIGTGIMLFPYLRLFNERLGLGYICFRFLEAVLISIGIVSVLAISTLASFYTNGYGINPVNFYSEATLLRAIHDWTFILGPHFILGINTFIYSYVLLKINLVPRKLAIMGLIGATLIFVAANLELFNVVSVNDLIIIFMAIPIAFYEMILAGWLIIKGFKLNNESIWI